ncbi:MAG: Hpt domain-containing protein [Polyangiaceae bacterium]
MQSIKRTSFWNMPEMLSCWSTSTESATKPHRLSLSSGSARPKGNWSGSTFVAKKLGTASSWRSGSKRSETAFCLLWSYWIKIPKRIAREGRIFELSPRPIECSGTLESVLFVVRDVTEVIERTRAERQAREEQAVITAAVHDREALCRSLVECSGLIDALRRRPDRPTTKRLLHTLKGNSAVLGFSSVAELCHELENLLNSDPERYDAPDSLVELSAAWNGVERMVRRLVPDIADARIELSEEEFQGFIERLQQANVPQSMLEMARSFRLTPTKRIFDTMSEIHRTPSAPSLEASRGRHRNSPSSHQRRLLLESAELLHPFVPQFGRPWNRVTRGAAAGRQIRDGQNPAQLGDQQRNADTDRR